MFDFDSALGVEILGGRLVLATVTKGFGGHTVKKHQVVEGATEMDRSELYNLIQGYIRSNGFNRENVILGLPCEQAVIRSVELPLDVEENLDEVVRFQVSKIEPNEDGLSYFDYVVLKRDAKAKSILLQIVMVPRQILDEQLQLLKELNLYPAAVRLSSYGLQQLLRLHKDGLANPSIVIQVDESRLEILLLAGPSEIYSRAVSINSEALTLDGILNELSVLVSRLRLHIDGFQKIYLCGSKASQFLNSFRERFGEAELLSSGLKLSVAAASNLRLEHIYPAAGLGVSGVNRSPFSRFNLIPPDKRIAGERSSLIPTVVLVVLLMVSLIAAGTREYVQQHQLLTAVETEVERLKPEVSQAMELRKQVETKLVHARELSQIMSGRQVVLDVMRELTELIPEDAYLQSLNARSDEVSITGLSDSASSLINILSESDCLTNVESRYITRDASSGKDKFNFEAKLKEGGCSSPN